MYRKSNVVGVVLVSVAVAFAGVGPATAEPRTTGDAFYVAPDPLPTGANGDLIRSEQVGLLAGLGTPLPVASTRILYQSADMRGVPTATSGIVLTPTPPWSGPGPRPLVSYAVGTHGAGDACAPSRLLTSGVGLDGSSAPATEAETLNLAALLARGYAVAVTDYQGLGTPGSHTYLQPVPQAHAVLDAARAAIRLGVTARDAPIGIWGYSQGGAVAAAAAEQAAGYAPDLAVTGTVAGAPPADPAVALQNVDGKTLAGLNGFFLNGLLSSHPELAPRITGMLNPAGVEFLHTTADQCVGGAVLRWGFRNTRDFTVTGQPLIDTLRADPAVRAVLDGFVLGGIAPADPVLIMQNTNDDVVAAGVAQQLAADWCAKGANVTYADIDTPPLIPQAGIVGHLSGYVFFDQAVRWLADRFAGLPAQPNCP